MQYIEIAIYCWASLMHIFITSTIKSTKYKRKNANIKLIKILKPEECPRCAELAGHPCGACYWFPWVGETRPCFEGRWRRIQFVTIAASYIMRGPPPCTWRGLPTRREAFAGQIYDHIPHCAPNRSAHHADRALTIGLYRAEESRSAHLGHF